MRLRVHLTPSRVAFRHASASDYSGLKGGIERSAAAASSSERVKSSPCDMPSCMEKTSRFSNERALIPRSIRLRKSTEISSNSANCSWLIFRASRIPFILKPNLSRKLATSRPRWASLEYSHPPDHRIRLRVTIQRKSEGGGFENQGKVSGERGQVSSELRSRERWLFPCYYEVTLSSYRPTCAK